MTVCRARRQKNKMVGPAGFEPATKGFTSAPMFPKGVDYLFTRAEQVEGGGVRDALACDQGPLEFAPQGIELSPQVVSAPSGGVPPAWLRVAMARCAGRVP